MLGDVRSYGVELGEFFKSEKLIWFEKILSD